jgi:hypothetical protein
MARSDAIAKTPTIEEEMAKFKGFSTTEGEVSKGEPTAKERKIAAVNTDGAAAAAAAVAADPEGDVPASGATGAAAPAAVELTETEEAAALDAAQTAKGEDELTEDEKDEAVAAALAAKTAAAPRRKRDPEARINQAVGRQRAAERALQTEREERARERGGFEARLAALEAGKGGLTPDKGATTTDPNAPRAEDFDLGELDPKFIRALARYEAKQEIAEAAKTQQTTAATTAQATARAEFQQKVTAFTEAGVKKYGEDFVADVIETAQAGEWPLPAVIGQLLFESPVGVEVAMFLSDPANLAEAKRIEKLSPTAQAVAFGRLEAKFSAPAAAAAGKTPVKATQAPPVPQSRARGAGGKSQATPDTNDFKAFEAMAMGKPN